MCYLSPNPPFHFPTEGNPQRAELVPGHMDAIYGKSLQERARLIISVAHPSAQEALDEAAFNRYGSHHHYIKGYMGK